MEAYKKEFIDFMVESDVLKFGEFTLKSGRKSPFFMNAGAYVTGSQLKRLGEYYAKAIHDTYGDDFDVLFGPAYKGIPISVVTAIAYSELYGKEIRYCSDRKEEKDHGADKGSFLGSKLKDGDRVVMIEDVTTSGKSMEETVPKVRSAADVEIVGLMVSLNRMEVGKGGEKSALDEIQEEYGFKANAIVSMADVVEYLYNKECNGKVVIDDTIKTAIDEYVPLATGADNAAVTQFTMTTIEELGLLKMDFLGLRTLTVIQDAEKMVRRKVPDFDITKIDPTDKEVYEMIGNGHTEGVFQLESSGMKSFMKELKPANMEDIIAGISLYRPGPMDFIPRYIEGKNHQESIHYECEQMEEILEPTYG